MNRPLIVQSDYTLLLEVRHASFEEARDAISPFSELEKSPEFIHTYRMTPLSLWNAASSGLNTDTIISTLQKYSRYDIPGSVLIMINEQMNRYGLIKLVSINNELYLISSDESIILEISSNKAFKSDLIALIDPHTIKIDHRYRGHIKQALIKIGYPVQDIAGYDDGDPCEIDLHTTSLKGKQFTLRNYQQSAVNAFYHGGGPEGGSGIIVLPCGAGKTIVGIKVMSLLKTKTLILVTNTVALRQWINELLDKTDVPSEYIGEFSGEKKEIRPITIATYNILTYRKNKSQPFVHFELFRSNNWGLIIYDEVHLLPAPIFRLTSEIQSKRRLGLTATLIREDGLETDVFSLIGPKKFDTPWKSLEKENWIASALCTEIRIELPEDLRHQYAIVKDKDKFRIASENYKKILYIAEILHKHKDANILIIGQYITQLRQCAQRFSLPLITGSTPVSERENLYNRFRNNEIKVIVVSKVANFSIDLPDANVAIQISGTFGSRQEEAQRLGRILRPKEGENRAYFYTLITSNTVEELFAHNRQLFLTEQGYNYKIMNESMFYEHYVNAQ